MRFVEANIAPGIESVFLRKLRVVLQYPIVVNFNVFQFVFQFVAL